MTPLFGPKAETVLSQGTPAQGTIIGIRITFTHDDAPTRLDEYAVLANGTVYGVRQQLMPDSDVRLGMSVPLRIDGKAVVIDRGEFNRHYWKVLGTPPAPGIEDDSNGLGAARKKWTPASITLGAINTRSVLMGMASVTDVAVVVTPAGDQPYETVLKNVTPAHYATHLFTPGTVLSGWVKPDRLDTVLIDWAAAAVATPGVGVPSAIATPAAEPVSLGTSASGSPSTDSVPELPGFMKKFGFTSTTPDEIDDPVSFETFVAMFKATGSGAVQGAEADAIAVQHGIPAGEWDAAQARWMGRISKDMKLGMAFGQALNG